MKEKLAQGPKARVGNKGYRQYLANQPGGLVIDQAKVKNEARDDGKWVLSTNTTLATDGVALTYQQWWAVEDLFRTMKSMLDTRPIHHQRDQTIRGHVFCSFLARVLRKALIDRLAAKGYVLEWADIIRDLNGLEEVPVVQQNKEFLLRSQVGCVCSKLFQAVGIALPPTVRAVTPREVTPA